MGSAFAKKQVTIAPTTVEPEVQVDRRKRNSLVLSVVDWVNAGEKDTKLESQARLFDASSKDPRGNKAAKTAESIALGNMRTLREQVIAHFAQINKKYGAWGNDALLHIVCREGYLRMVQFMVDPKNVSQYETTLIDYNALNDKRRTPLHVVFTPPHATYCGVKFGCDDGEVRAKRPADLASMSDTDWIRPGTPQDRMALVELLVDKGADPHRLDYQDHSPLHYACLCGWTPCVTFLLSRGADPEVTNAAGQNALMVACEFRHADIAELLIDTTTVPLEAKNHEGETALLYAIEAGDVACVELLCQFGANANAASYANESALKRACRRNDADIVHVLLDFRVTRHEPTLDLLHGEAKKAIEHRLRREHDEKQREFEAAQHAATRSGAGDKDVRGRPPGPRSSVGRWVPYRDKHGGGLFYYNKVSRICQREVPVDYVKDLTYLPKDAIFGLHFMH